MAETNLDERRPSGLLCLGDNVGTCQRTKRKTNGRVVSDLGTGQISVSKQSPGRKEGGQGGLNASVVDDGQRGNTPIPSHGHPRERASGSCSPICSCVFGPQGGAGQHIPFVCSLFPSHTTSTDARDQLERVPRSSIDQSGSTVDSSDRLNRCNSLLPGSAISHL